VPGKKAITIGGGPAALTAAFELLTRSDVNNWSPYMVKDPDTDWVGVEYFCYQADDLWTMP
jgi:uncharacterized NAD(P)/FAD-binding protein YdhS